MNMQIQAICLEMKELLEKLDKLPQQPAATPRDYTRLQNRILELVHALEAIEGRGK